MRVNIPIEDMLKIEFTRDNSGYRYSNVLYLLPDHSYTEEEIEAMKDDKYNRWVDFIEEQSMIVTPEPDTSEGA
jgi:hypothetical protein